LEARHKGAINRNELRDEFWKSIVEVDNRMQPPGSQMDPTDTLTIILSLLPRDVLRVFRVEYGIEQQCTGGDISHTGWNTREPVLFPLNVVRFGDNPTSPSIAVLDHLQDVLYHKTPVCVGDSLCQVLDKGKECNLRNFLINHLFKLPPILLLHIAPLSPLQFHIPLQDVNFGEKWQLQAVLKCESGHCTLQCSFKSSWYEYDDLGGGKLKRLAENDLWASKPLPKTAHYIVCYACLDVTRPRYFVHRHNEFVAAQAKAGHVERAGEMLD
jgi:hypothetical protein